MTDTNPQTDNLNQETYSDDTGTGEINDPDEDTITLPDTSVTDQSPQKTTHPTKPQEPKKDKKSDSYPSFNLKNIDTKKVEETRLWWVNYERSTKGLDPLELDTNLIKSSTERAQFLANNKQFSNMHKRPGQKEYYSTDTIMSRAQRLGLIDDSINTIGESILWGSANFSSTDTLLTSTKGKSGGPSWFLGFLMGEKKKNGVHYRMMMTASYTKVGFGFANAGKYPKAPSRWNQYIEVIHFGN